VKVRIGIGGSIIVDYNVHPFHIDTTTKNISCDKDTLFKRFERRVSGDTVQECQTSSIETLSESNIPFLLSKTGVNGDRWKIARDK
jgi:hypothetical protein